jgi:hypothetical protein
MELLMCYEQTMIKEPVEKRGIDRNLWIWEYADFSKQYMVVADTSTGDGTDFSTFHVLDIASLVQVAEYKGKMSTKDFGNFLVTVATEYNNALLIPENNSIGWATIQAIIDRGYSNLFYTSEDLTYVDADNQMTNKYRSLDKKMKPGFTTSSKTRPLIISKIDLYFKEKSVIVYSKRLIEELKVFSWNGSKVEALKGYNDDLVIPFGIGLWVRDTALLLNNKRIDLTKKSLGLIAKTTNGVVASNTPSALPIYSNSNSNNTNPYNFKVGESNFDLRDLF